LFPDDPEQIRGAEREYLRDFANYFNKALNFRVGAVAELLSPEDLCGGATDDYYASYWKINISYTIELDPSIDNWMVGFKLPEKHIRPVGRKLFNSFVLMSEKMDSLYPHLNRRSSYQNKRPRSYNFQHF